MIHGQCLRGAVALEIDEPLEHDAQACHCVQCRRQTGTYFVGVNVRRSARLVLRCRAAFPTTAMSSFLIPQSSVDPNGNPKVSP